MQEEMQEEVQIEQQIERQRAINHKTGNPEAGDPEPVSAEDREVAEGGMPEDLDSFSISEDPSPHKEEPGWEAEYRDLAPGAIRI